MQLLISVANKRDSLAGQTFFTEAQGVIVFGISDNDLRQKKVWPARLAKGFKPAEARSQLCSLVYSPTRMITCALLKAVTLEA